MRLVQDQGPELGAALVPYGLSTLAVGAQPRSRLEVMLYLG